jgi:SAM-dependent methyltransferase
MTSKLLDFPVLGSGSCPAARAGTIPGVDPEQIAAALDSGMCPTDATFDQFLSGPMRALSSQFWTPLAVAARAAEWFDERNIRTVVDIGSGAGKFCVGAALAGHCHFTGLEHRERLVTTARALARTFKVESRVHFIQGALGTARLPAADVYYLYNPFEENVLEGVECIDEDVELSAERYTRDLSAVRELLVAARTGTYVLTYNGFGARLPAGYRHVCVDHELPNVLSLWRKAAPRLMLDVNQARAS